MENYTEIFKGVISMVQEMISSALHKAAYDKTFRAIVINKLANNRYEIEYKGNRYSARCKIPLDSGSIVTVCAPQNNWNELYIQCGENEDYVLKYLNDLIADANPDMEKVQSIKDFVSNAEDTITAKTKSVVQSASDAKASADNALKSKEEAKASADSAADNANKSKNNADICSQKVEEILDSSNNALENAQLSEKNATIASKKADEAQLSASNASISESNAKKSEQIVTEKENIISQKAIEISSAEQTVLSCSNEVASNSNLSKRYAVGGVVAEDVNDNAKYYYEQAKNIKGQIDASANLVIPNFYIDFDTGELKSDKEIIGMKIWLENGILYGEI